MLPHELHKGGFMIFGSYMKEVCDPFDVSVRIQDFVPSWRLFYNLRESRYEVHDIESGEWRTLVSVLPFDRIDQRTIDYLKKHRKDRFGKIMREIDDNNADIARRQITRAQLALEDSLRKHT